MILIAEMQSGGVFEAESKKKLTAAMIKYFSENNCKADRIKSIFVIKNCGKTDEFCNLVVERIQEIVDCGVSESLKQAQIEYFGQIEIESEIRDMI